MIAQPESRHGHQEQKDAFDVGVDEKDALADDLVGGIVGEE